MLHDQPTKLNVTWRKAVWMGAAMSCGVGLALLLLAALCGAGEPPALAAPLASPGPALISITPARAYNDQATVITITGSNFAATPTVYLNYAWLEDVGFVDSATLTATVPADLPGGVYTLTVTNPDWQNTRRTNAFTVDWAGDGELGAWQATSPMNNPRDFVAAVAAGDYIYALGGWGQATTERARINPDGALGAWQTLTATMTTRRAEAGAIAARGYIYAVGGTNLGAPLASVERAPIQADGTLGAWQVLTATLNVARRGAKVVATDRYIYVIGGDYVPQDSRLHCVNSVERAAINADGTLSAWQTLMAPLNIARSYFGVAQVAGNIYAMGGMTCLDGSSIGDPIPRGDVERATIQADGTLGPWRTMTSHLVMPRYLFAGTQAAGNLYAIGGQGITQYLDNLAIIEVAAVGSDGEIGAWQTLESRLNIPRNSLAAVLARGRLYVVGGHGGNDLSSVEQTLVNSPYLISFDPSAFLTTQSTDVTVWGANLLHVSDLRLPDNTPLSITAGTTWKFTATIPAGLAPGWYAATVTLQNGATATQPNLFLVQAPPPFLPPAVYLPLTVQQNTLACGDYFDDFSWPWGKWRVGNDGWVLTEYLYDEYRVMSEVAGYVYWFTAPTCRRQNYTVEAEARWVADSGDDYGLIFGLNANDQYYLFGVSPYYGDYSLYRHDPGKWTALKGWTVNAAVHAGGASNHLKVTRNGTQIRLDLNGAYLGTWTDGTTSGPTRVGLYSTSYEGDPVYPDARFDNYRITTLPGATSPSVAAQSEPGILGGSQASAPVVDRDPAPPRGRP